MEEIIRSTYGNKVRLRACGILVENDTILLAKHLGIGTEGILWAPPGGSVDFGEELGSAVVREFDEETGLKVEVGRFLYLNEFIQNELHAIELFFKVKRLSGDLITGIDPEFDEVDQIISEVRFVTFNELKIMSPNMVHNTLRNVTDKQTLLNMAGHFKFCQ